MKRFLLLFLLAFSSAGQSEPYVNGFDLRDSLVPSEQIFPGGPPRDGIPAIDRPRFVKAEKSEISPNDRVLGLVMNGIAKAYPIAILNWHEIVNDRFRNEPVVVSFCPLCGSGMASIARIDGRKHRIPVPGRQSLP